MTKEKWIKKLLEGNIGTASTAFVSKKLADEDKEIDYINYQENGGYKNVGKQIDIDIYTHNFGTISTDDYMESLIEDIKNTRSNMRSEKVKLGNLTRSMILGQDQLRGFTYDSLTMDQEESLQLIKDMKSSIKRCKAEIVRIVKNDK